MDSASTSVKDDLWKTSYETRRLEEKHPRAYVEYKHDKVPEPRYFKAILENSLSNTEMQFFCEYFIRPLHYGTKQHKEKVLCLIGQPNSGKTSSFAFISRIIPER